MEKTIVTAFMVIVSVVISVMIYNVVYPAAVQSSASLRTMRDRMDDRIQTQATIIHATSEIDKDGVWQDTNGDGQVNVFIWTKNIGSSRIAALNQIDLFYGPDGNFSRIAQTAEVGGAFPNWDWQIENNETWDPTTTLKITINLGAQPASGRYFIKLVLPAGNTTDYFFSL